MRNLSALPHLLIATASVLAATSIRPSNAHAQGNPDRVAAESLFTEGRALLKAGRISEACAKLEASQKLDPAPGTLLNLGDCYEKAGRTASAWLAFRDAAATSAGPDPGGRVAHMRARAAALEPKLCRLRIDVDSKATLPVMRDANVVDKSVYGQAVPVDPGSIVISVREGDHVHFMRTVEVAPTASACETKSVQIPAIATTAASTATPAATATVPAAAAIPLPDTTPEAAAANDQGRATHTNVPPLVVASAGPLLIGVGVLVGINAKSTWDEARGLCVAAGCGPEAQSKAADARSGAGVATLVIGAGALMLAGGLTWFVLVPKTRGDRTALRLAPSVHASGGTLAATGTF